MVEAEEALCLACGVCADVPGKTKPTFSHALLGVCGQQILDLLCLALDLHQLRN